jgi:hypothetical protein
VSDTWGLAKVVRKVEFKLLQPSPGQFNQFAAAIVLEEFRSARVTSSSGQLGVKPELPDCFVTV